ncbi:class I SAM-dependent methyltransferase [Aeromicrobium sp. UC242_57]|uniref:class I SAM-dependent methyltransferase n=1 Tax=Aeromicrobium sp. UC242_57 TaxID=3374624 RepID=UPI0037A9FBAD
MSLAGLIDRWDSQQAAYIADREKRFDAMLDVLGLDNDGDFTVVDLACGPGSLSTRVLDRFDRARVVGIDFDPMLLHVARSQVDAYEGRLSIVDADLTDPSWPDRLGDVVAGAPQAFVSSTALHWLTPAQLLDVYATSYGLLAPGGTLLNGDHLRFDGRTPRVKVWAQAHDEQTQARAFAEGAPPWDEWWTELAALPHLAELQAERDRRFAGRDSMPPTAVDLHLAALAQAGFGEVGTVWQLSDDYVVYGAK